MSCVHSPLGYSTGGVRGFATVVVLQRGCSNKHESGVWHITHSGISISFKHGGSGPCKDLNTVRAIKPIHCISSVVVPAFQVARYKRNLISKQYHKGSFLDIFKLRIIYLATEMPYGRTIIKITHDESVVYGLVSIDIYMCRSASQGIWMSGYFLTANAHVPRETQFIIHHHAQDSYLSFRHERRAIT